MPHLLNVTNLFIRHCNNIVIVADGFKLDDFSELNKIKKQEIVNFKITAYDPHLYVNLSESSATIYISDENDIRLRGLLEQIEGILSERRSPLRFIFGPWMLVVYAFLLLFLTIWPFIFKEYKTQGLILLFLIQLSAVLLLIWGRRTDTKKHSLIFLEDHSSAPTFFKRNKDSILLAILSGGIGGIITLIISWLLKII